MCRLIPQSANFLNQTFRELSSGANLFMEFRQLRDAVMGLEQVLAIRVAGSVGGQLGVDESCQR
jgi:hypothetical protein